jgi:hypothetical protein
MLAVALGLGCFFTLGMLVGGFLFAVGNAQNSYDIFEVTNLEGHTYWLTDPYEVDAALRVDGMLTVRRLRVLT